MKSSIHLPLWVVAIFFVLGAGGLVQFVVHWRTSSSVLEKLTQIERDLRGELEQLEVYGKWTIDYLKIDRALNSLVGDKLSESVCRQLTDQLWQISRSYSLDPILILAVVDQESRGNPNARGRMRSGKFSGALGLMQIKLETAQSMGKRFGLSIESEEDLLRPEVNITVGTAYLIRLIMKYGNWREALIAYNLGHSAVDRLLENSEPLPTRYYEHVISKYRHLVGVAGF